MSVFSRIALLSSALCLSACGNSVELTSKLSPQPPMWVVSDADSEITLYPTVHILPPEINWKSDELTRRLSEAEEVWFELMPGSQNDPALQGLVMELGMAPGSSISTNLTPEEVKALKAAITPLGLPFQAADMMKPWMLMNLITIGALQSAGFDPESGVEQQLQPLVEGKTIRALETAEQQMRLLASVPKDEQMQMLREALTEMDEGLETITEIANDWAVGDVDEMEDELIDEMKSETPKAYDIIFTQRNKNWADQIEIEMKGSGTDFIAVGAGHLVGEDSVPTILKARGYSVTRL